VIAFAMLGDGDRAGELFAMLNPIHRTSTRAGVHRYKVEPYVVAADVYAEPPHAGRGGWSWYTGAAGWLYRAGLESILGLRRHGATFAVDPCIPAAWDEYSISWRVGRTRYEIAVFNPEGCCRGVAEAQLDGQDVDPGAIPLAGDGGTHVVRVVLGSRPANARPPRRRTALSATRTSRAASRAGRG
jgi:cyclic beta-1,2-glucan synthetase